MQDGAFECSARLTLRAWRFAALTLERLGVSPREGGDRRCGVSISRLDGIDPLLAAAAWSASRQAQRDDRGSPARLAGSLNYRWRRRRTAPALDPARRRVLGVARPRRSRSLFVQVAAGLTWATAARQSGGSPITTRASPVGRRPRRRTYADEHRRYRHHGPQWRMSRRRRAPGGVAHAGRTAGRDRLLPRTAGTDELIDQVRDRRGRRATAERS